MTAEDFQTLQTLIRSMDRADVRLSALPRFLVEHVEFIEVAVREKVQREEQKELFKIAENPVK